MRTTRFLKALADDTRLRTFRALSEAKTGLCVAEMADILRKPQYAISRSFIELKKAGLLQEDRQGKFVYYSLVQEPSIQDLGEWVLQNCQCEDATDRNTDGSSVPGGQGCTYDSERLKWRLSLREPAKAPVTRNTEKENLDLRPRVLFVCIHNSARSQLAEEYLRQIAGEQFYVESAGLTPGALNPHVVAILGEDGIDISQKKTQAVGDLFRRGETYQWVVTVCSREAEENCPVFPGPVRRLSWPFADPSRFTGTEADVRTQVRTLAAEIKAQVEAFVKDLNEKEKP
jgi:arsenate reductase